VCRRDAANDGKKRNYIRKNKLKKWIEENKIETMRTSDFDTGPARYALRVEELLDFINNKGE
jgi:hypothetical protein